MNHVLLAPDKFKGTLTGLEVADALRAGIHAVRPGAVVDTLPVADGGDGLLAAVLGAGFSVVPVDADDAVGARRRTRYARRGDAAVIELAEIAGLAALSAPAPTTATSRGLGQVIAAALDAGARSITVGIGGSASTDGGVGMLQALGARVLDAEGTSVTAGVDVARAVRLDCSGLHRGLAGVELVFACDVDNPLTGPDGAASVYGPQKGADAEQVRELDAALANWAALVARSGSNWPDRYANCSPIGDGAAGGIGFGARAVLGARLAPGAALVLDLVGFDAALAAADLVVTGEGSLDEQTLHGKGPAEVARRGRAAGVPVLAVAGRCRLTPEQTASAGFECTYVLTDLAGDPLQAMTHGPQLLHDVGSEIATTYLDGER